jgi:ABC-type multidrug transport system fused ATPase/permease subunit
VVAGCITNLAAALLPLSVGFYFQLITGESSGKGSLLRLVGIYIDTESQFYLLFAFFILCRALFLYLEKILALQLSIRVEKQIRDEFFDVLAQTESWDEHLQVPSLRRIRKAIRTGIIRFSGDLFFLIIAGCLLFQIHPDSFYIFLLLVILTFVSGYLIAFFARKSDNVRREKSGSLRKYMQKILSGQEAILALNRQNPVVRKLKNLSDKELKSTLRSALKKEVLSFIQPVIFFGSLLLLLHLMSKNDDTSVLFTVILLFLYLQGSLRRSLTVPLTLMSGINEFKKIAFLSDNYLAQTVSDVPDSRVFKIELQYSNGRALKGFWTRGSVYCMKNHPVEERRTITDRLLGIGAKEISASINDTELTTRNIFSARKLISVAASHYKHSFRTVAEYCCYTVTEERLDKLHTYIRRFELQSVYSDDLMKTIQQNRPGVTGVLALIRALMSSKTILILYDTFETLNQNQTDELVRIIKNDYSDRIVIVTGECPESLSAANCFMEE